MPIVNDTIGVGTTVAPLGDDILTDTRSPASDVKRVTRETSVFPHRTDANGLGLDSMGAFPD